MKTRSEHVYEALLKIPKGKVTTYKELAHFVGTRSYRGIGQILKRNPNAPQVPCHRVISSDGSLGGYDGKFNSSRKINLLKEEGVQIKNGKIDLERFLFRFSD